MDQRLRQRMSWISDDGGQYLILDDERMLDKDQVGSMEKKKREGYF